MNADQLQFFLDLANQLFALAQKADQLEESHSLQRNFDRLQLMLSERLEVFAEPGVGLEVHNPLGESYDETRTDCSASIAGEGLENLTIVEVIKPIIRLRHEQMSRIVQQGVVIVKSSNTP